MKRLNMLTARTLANDLRPGRHADGGNLYLMVSASGSKRWTFMYEYKGHQREAGLGSIMRVPAWRAREKAAEFRLMLADGLDPLAARERVAKIPTFGEVAAACIESKRSGWRSPVHAQQWESTIADHCKDISLRKVDGLDSNDVLAILKPIWNRIPETASRLRGRIEMIFDFAKAKKWRTGENPAAMKGNLADVLPRRQKVAKANHPALPFVEVPAFYVHIRGKTTAAARALSFAILTAARSGEVRGATWSEIDLDVAVWNVPAGRMKSGQPHTVPLAPRAVEILRAVGQSDGLIFPARSGKPLDAKALGSLVPKGSTVHGFRAAFKTWCGETGHPRELAEKSLAHAIGNEAERAYARGEMLERRRRLMCAWAQFCEDSAVENVVPIRGVS